LQISNLLPARSLENPVKAQATPDCKRQFETDTHSPSINTAMSGTMIRNGSFQEVDTSMGRLKAR
jgi:hypothetical protein